MARQHLCNTIGSVGGMWEAGACGIPLQQAPRTAPAGVADRRKEGHIAHMVTIVTRCAVKTCRHGILPGMPGTLEKEQCV